MKTNPYLKPLMYLSACLLITSLSYSQSYLKTDFKASPSPAIIPAPQKIILLPGDYLVRERTIFVNYLEMQQFAGEVHPGHTPIMDIKAELLAETDTLIGSEGYYLTIDSTGIKIRANTSGGLFYGHQTLRQIVMQQNDLNKATLLLPYLSITDYPKFPWRGMLLDACRHFMEKEFVLRYIDLLAFYKMNVLHWHLTEDQGWRIQIKQYPLLTEKGAWRREANGTIYGGFYTQEDIREVVAYAASRNITVVPEIEMPGHAMAALTAYPGLSCIGGSFEVPSTWGVFKDIYCAGNDSVFIFLKNVLSEVMGLFPSEHIHIGGDEAPKYRWKQCNKCQSRIKDLNLKDEHELQSWFIGEIAKFLKSSGRTLIGWDEIIEGGLVNGVTVQSWRSFDGARHAAETGNNAVVSPTSHAYFDYPVHKLTLQKVYNFDPIPEGLDSSLHHHILGGACNMWTERAPQELVDQKMFPRILAMAEVLWRYPEKVDSTFPTNDDWTKTHAPERDYPHFRSRVRRHYPLLTALGVNYGLEEGGLTIVAENTTKGIIVSMIPEQNNITIRYGTEADSSIHPYRYTTPILIPGYLIIHAAAYIDNKRVSEIFTRRFHVHQGIGLSYLLSRKPDGTYNKNPGTTLTDGIRGTTDFHDGLWLGFWEKDINIDIRLKEAKTISVVRIGVLQSNPSWIFLPAEIAVIIKPKGIFSKRIRNRIVSSTPRETISITEDFWIPLEKPVTIKRIKIKVKNSGTCPDWHPAAGSPTWIFIDEIELR